MTVRVRYEGPHGALRLPELGITLEAGGPYVEIPEDVYERIKGRRGRRLRKAPKRKPEQADQADQAKG